MSKTLIILNPHAGSGQAGRVWQKLEPLLWQNLGELVVAVTQRPEEVAEHLDKAYASGLTRVISIGGDGTNHALVNALAQLNEQHPNGSQMVYGNLPIGSGRDWARMIGTPFNIEAAARWISSATPRSVDVGELTYGSQREYFLNIASAGISGAIAAETNLSPIRKPWTFLTATIRGIIKYNRVPLQIALDGQTWYDGKAYIVAVANGTTFARGMKIAPNAEIDDGLFDVVLVKDAPTASILAALWRVYNGTHLSHPAVQSARAAEVVIQSNEGLLGFEADGEDRIGPDLRYRIRPGLLQLLA